MFTTAQVRKKMHDTRVDEALVLLLDHSEPQVLAAALYVCPHTTICVSSYYYMCVLMLLSVCRYRWGARIGLPSC